MDESFWSWTPISQELLDDATVMRAAIDKNYRELRMTRLFGESRHDPLDAAERGTRTWDSHLYDMGCDCDCGCEECGSAGIQWADLR